MLHVAMMILHQMHVHMHHCITESPSLSKAVVPSHSSGPILAPHTNIVHDKQVSMGEWLCS